MMKKLMTILALATLGTTSAWGNDMRPVRIYVLAGQSNMQGKGAVEGDHGGSLRGLVKNHPGQYGFLVDANGEWVERKDVWAFLDQYPRTPRYSGMMPGYGSSGGQVGPEIGFGHKIGDVHEGQVLVIKACWGGKSVGHNFLPPSIGQYPKPIVPQDAGFYYHEILRIVKDVTENIGTYFPDYQGQGVEIAGFCWHQGWNDQYGGLDLKYETNLAAFIKDIRSVEHGLGVPGLPFVIATSGMIQPDSPVVQGQLAIGDSKKYPEFVGNVAVIDTHKPYGTDKMTFKFDNNGVTEKVGYHWNNNARSYTNIGIAMAGEMPKLKRPTQPSRFRAFGTKAGIQLHWQLGTQTPKGVEILRNGKSVDARLSPTRTNYTDISALPGVNRYELILDMPSGNNKKFSASCDTSVTNLEGYRSLEGVMLSWEAKGKYEAFRISRDGEIIADAVAAGLRSFEDKTAPAKGKVRYTIQPTTGKVPPAEFVINLGPANTGGALLYEPFDYPASEEEVQILIGKSGALGTKGGYIYLNGKPGREPATMPKSLKFGDLPVTGNSGSTHRWCEGGYIELDDSLRKAGLLKDGATLWMSYVFIAPQEPKYTHRSGGGMFTLRSADMQEGVGFKGSGRQYETVVVMEGKEKAVRITGTRPNTPILVVGRITWGKDGENDAFVPFFPTPDLECPEKHGRASAPFNIDQSKISRLVLHGEGQFDEIRVGPTFESVVGGGNK